MKGSGVVDHSAVIKGFDAGGFQGRPLSLSPRISIPEPVIDACFVDKVSRTHGSHHQQEDGILVVIVQLPLECNDIPVIKNLLD